MKTCLLVIDVQESFLHRPYFSADDLASYLSAQNALIAKAQAEKVAIVRVLHADDPNEMSNPFSLISGLVRPLTGLVDFVASATFYKSRHSALVGSGLLTWLIQQGIGRIVVSGIRTEQCCETTTRHASDIGFQVDFCVEATLTFAMQYSSGEVLSASEIKARTALVLQDRFARICAVDTVFA